MGGFLTKLRLTKMQNDRMYTNDKLNAALQAAYKAHEADPSEANGGIVLGLARAVDIVREYILTGKQT